MTANKVVYELIAILLLVTFASGCADIGTRSEGGSKQEISTYAARDSGYATDRSVTALGQATVLYAQSVHVDPILRPVSHFSSLVSLLLKSAGGALNRVTLSSFRMPAIQGPVTDVSNAAPMDLLAFEDQLDKITGTRRADGTIDFLVDGEEYFTRLEEAIDEAKESVDIRTYIFDNDEYAVSIAEQLKDRSSEVRIRVMLDTLGNLMATQTDPESLPEDHEPPLSMTMHLEQGSKVQVRNLSNPWFTGDHTKTTIMDGKIAFVGGMNIGREYRYDWHDLMMEVRGPVVNQLQHESDKTWARASLFGDVGNFFMFLRGKGENADTKGYPVRVLQTRNFDSQIYRAQLAAIRASKSYILIENPYFADDQVMYELAKARRRGVDVRVILPTQGNHGPVHKSNQVATNQMLENGIRVYQYPGMSHVKAAIFDGWVCVGSANFDKLSLQINKELNLATSDAGVVNELIDRVFLPDLMISTEVNEPVELAMTAKLAEMFVDELL